MSPDMGSLWPRTRDTRALTGEEKMRGRMPRTEAGVMPLQGASRTGSRHQELGRGKEGAYLEYQRRHGPADTSI